MKLVRSAVILIDQEKVALIRRVNVRGTYYLFPGGGVEEGETPAEAAVREAQEELGLEVETLGLAAVVEYGDAEQQFYLARRTSGVFGTGQGEELASPIASARGTYTPVWLECRRLHEYEVRPAELARRLAAGSLAGEALPLFIQEAPYTAARTAAP
jgi:ADP-ribose pyrophosphatase YjhB (NUDIX family)